MYQMRGRLLQMRNDRIRKPKNNLQQGITWHGACSITIKIRPVQQIMQKKNKLNFSGKSTWSKTLLDLELLTTLSFPFLVGKEDEYLLGGSFIPTFLSPSYEFTHKSIIGGSNHPFSFSRFSFTLHTFPGASSWNSFHSYRFSWNYLIDWYGQGSFAVRPLPVWQFAVKKNLT